MTAKSKIMPGEIFGRLTTISRSADHVKSHWLCQCSCGNRMVVSGSNLKTGNTQSCGCRKLEILAKRCTIHGEAAALGKSVEYRIYIGMIKRCENPNDRAYKNYGGRGIRVCQRWRASFVNFINDMGRRPSADHSIDRYPDQNGNYEPKNCRWATRTEQSHNRRSNRIIVRNGERMTLDQLAISCGVSRQTIALRLDRGLDIEDVIRPHKIKLTEEDIAQIRREAPYRTRKSLASIFGVSSQHISNIINGRAYRSKSMNPRTEDEAELSQKVRQ